MADDSDEGDLQQRPIAAKAIVPRISESGHHVSPVMIWAATGRWCSALLYMVIAIMAFVFGVTTNNTIARRKPAVIGTLRASGYTKRRADLLTISGHAGSGDGSWRQ